MFGREYMVWRNGGLVKDLSYLNRDPGSLVILDSFPAKVFQKENLIYIPEFQGDSGDHTLKEVLPFLKSISSR